MSSANGSKIRVRLSLNGCDVNGLRRLEFPVFGNSVPSFGRVQFPIGYARTKLCFKTCCLARFERTMRWLWALTNPMISVKTSVPLPGDPSVPPATCFLEHPAYRSPNHHTTDGRTQIAREPSDGSRALAPGCVFKKFTTPLNVYICDYISDVLYSAESVFRGLSVLSSNSRACRQPWHLCPPSEFRPCRFDCLDSLLSGRFRVLSQTRWVGRLRRLVAAVAVKVRIGLSRARGLAAQIA